jgi:hypothetical protein
VHGLAQQNVTARNTIMIGKALGSLLEVDDLDNSGLICRQHLRFRVELNTSLPLVPGFNLPQPDKEPFWISFRYERLGDYCTLCGLIGHKKPSCPNPPQPYPLAKYNIPLQASSFSSLRNVSFSLREDSDSGISLDGTAHSRSEAHSSSSHGIESTHLQLVPRVTLSQMSEHVALPPSTQVQSNLSLSLKCLTIIMHHLHQQFTNQVALLQPRRK